MSPATGWTPTPLPNLPGGRGGSGGGKGVTESSENLGHGWRKESFVILRKERKLGNNAMLKISFAGENNAEFRIRVKAIWKTVQQRLVDWTLQCPMYCISTNSVDFGSTNYSCYQNQQRTNNYSPHEEEKLIDQMQQVPVNQKNNQVLLG